MKFYHKVEPEIIFELYSLSEDRYIVNWIIDGKGGFQKYTKEEVEDNFKDGTWILK